MQLNKSHVHCYHSLLNSARCLHRLIINPTKLIEGPHKCNCSFAPWQSVQTRKLRSECAAKHVKLELPCGDFCCTFVCIHNLINLTYAQERERLSQMEWIVLQAFLTLCIHESGIHVTCCIKAWTTSSSVLIHDVTADNSLMSFVSYLKDQFLRPLNHQLGQYFPSKPIRYTQTHVLCPLADYMCSACMEI